MSCWIGIARCQTYPILLLLHRFDPKSIGNVGEESPPASAPSNGIASYFIYIQNTLVTLGSKVAEIAPGARLARHCSRPTGLDGATSAQQVKGQHG